jgi:very-short-patch-repair endonuclease
MYNNKIGSHAEDWFYHEFRKRSRIPIEQQYIVGKYRIDFVVTDPSNGRKIGIEIDGKMYHNTEQDSVRDSRIINNSDISCIVRFEAHDLMYNAPFITIALLKKFPSLFNNEHSLDKIKQDALNYLKCQGV